MTSCSVCKTKLAKLGFRKIVVCPNCGVEHQAIGLKQDIMVSALILMVLSSVFQILTVTATKNEFIAFVAQLVALCIVVVFVHPRITSYKASGGST